MEDESNPRLWDLPYEQRVAIFRHEINRVTARLSEIDVEHFNEPAGGDWTIREVVAHLVYVAEFYTANLNRGAAGDAGPLSGQSPAGTGRGEAAASGIRIKAEQVADTMGATGVDRLRTSALLLADALDADESSLEFECYHPGGTLPANRFAVLYLKELGLHEWDIFESLDSPCQMTAWGVDAAFQALEEELASGSLRWLTEPESGDDTLTIRVTTTGDLELQRDLLLEPSGTRLVNVAEDRNVDSSLTLDAADFVLACSGRGDLVGLVAAGRGEGDPDAVRLLDRRLTGM